MRSSTPEWDVARFGPGARRWLTGMSVVLFFVVLLVGVPVLWRWLDRAPLLGAVSTAVPAEGHTAWGRLYTVTYVSSLAPALAAVGAYLLWTVRCGPGKRMPTLLLVSIGVLAVVQCAFVTAGWGEPTTGKALGERLDRAGISLWAHDVIERGWYVGYAALAAGFGSAVFASTRAARPHAWFAVLLIPATVLPWLLLSGGHLSLP